MSDKPVLQYLKLSDEAREPIRSTPKSACWDVFALSDFFLYQGKPQAVGTGLRLIIPKGYRVDVRPRSGLAVKHGVTVFNSPGTIDEDYAGELKIILCHAFYSSAVLSPYQGNAGDRIAQIALERVIEFDLENICRAPEDFQDRGGGLGSTGR